MEERAVRQRKRKSWYRYISDLERDIHVQHDRAYKTMKDLNKSRKDTLCINPITECDWLQYCDNLWTSTDDNEIK
jgi:hypothetical protein